MSEQVTIVYEASDVTDAMARGNAPDVFWIRRGQIAPMTHGNEER